MEPIICNGARMWSYKKVPVAGNISKWCKENYGKSPSVLTVSTPSILDTIEFGSRARRAAERDVFIAISVYYQTDYLYTFFCTNNEEAAAHFKLVWCDD